ncbi:ABC transporter permease [Dethiothermospora halolimnae]|uniref:ABC transporter permease n=1 Tax=Dethiothermospora halolimnae TaxID=3114390 RepID=UPI003CCC143A
MINLHIGKIFEKIVDWLDTNFEPLFDFITEVIDKLITGLQDILLFPPNIVLIVIFVLLAWKAAGKGVSLFTLIGLGLIVSMDLWEETIETLSLVMASAIIALIIGIPLGIWASRSKTVDKVIRPILDFMQTMPAFVYLIPAVLFFDMGNVPGAIATVIFAMPPVVRLTNLGIRQVPTEVVEAAKSFGSTSKQMLIKVQLPIALPTILAGVNQTIMLSLSMVVIASMIGARGLGEKVYSGITQLQIGTGFEGGVAVVILAMILDRITQALGNSDKVKQ